MNFLSIFLQVIRIVCIFVLYPSFRYGQVEARGGHLYDARHIVGSKPT